MILKSFARREHSNNPKTHPLRLKKQAAFHGYRRSADALRLELVNWFVKAAVSEFAAGNTREARRYYDGAFEFGSKDLIRGRLFGCLLATAKRAHASGNHEAVVQLLAAAHFYPPALMSVQDIHGLFARDGVPLGDLVLEQSEEPLKRLRCVGVDLLALATA